MAAQDKRGRKFWDSLTPAQKAAEFEASERDPGGYAASNFEDPDTTTQLRVVKPTEPTQGDKLPRRGRHKKG